MFLRRWAGDFLKKSVEWFNTELLDTVQKASLSFTDLGVLMPTANGTGGVLSPGCVDHCGNYGCSQRCRRRGRASNGHEADGSCLVIKGISCERGHHCDEHVQKACVKVK